MAEEYQACDDERGGDGDDVDQDGMNVFHLSISVSGNTRMVPH